MMTRADKAVAVAILAVSVILHCVFGIYIAKDEAVSAVVYVDGEVYAEYRLRDMDKPKRVEIKSKYGCNLLEIAKDGAEMLDADCPDKIDVRCGRITQSGQILVCTPNRVTVRLTGGKNNEIDGVSY